MPELTAPSRPALLSAARCRPDARPAVL